VLGQYERGAFKYALQKAGLMTIPVYGTIKDYWGYDELEGEKDAIQEQSRP
jgi:hypothetical protein